MALISEDKLREKLQECIDADGYLYGDEKQAAQNLLADLPGMEVDPADLDKMNLAALGVLEEIKRDIDFDKEEADRMGLVNAVSVGAWLERRIANLEFAANLEAESRRSEEEIRVAMDWLTTSAQKEEERSHEGPFGPGRIEVDICEHRSRVFKNCVSFYNWTQGEENEWSKTFTPSGDKQKEATGETG